MSNVIRAPFGGRPAADSDAPFDREVTEPAPPPPGDGHGEGDGQDPPRTGEPQERDLGPAVPLGTATIKGKKAYVFLDADGERQAFTARDLGQRLNLISLYGGGGAAKARLAELWPEMTVPRAPKGKPAPPPMPSGDFEAEAAASDLMQACGEIGSAESVELRKDGLWPWGKGLLFHGGRDLLVGEELVRPGLRDGKAIYIACDAREMPALPEDAATPKDVAGLSKALKLWVYAQPDLAPKLLLGLVAVGLLGAAAPWRPHVFLRGPKDAGKSSLARVLAAACGIGDVSDDLSAPGLRRMFDGRSGLIPLDEREADAPAVADIAKIMRGSSDGRGSVTVMADPDGGGSKAWRVAGSFLMAAITVPALTDADASRITMVQLRRPPARARTEISGAVALARQLHPRLLRRMIDGWDRWKRAFALARDAATKLEATSRSADQVGALMAGWFVLAEDGELTARRASAEMAALTCFLTMQRDAQETETGHLILRHLLGSRVALAERSSDQSTVLQGIVDYWRALNVLDKAPASDPATRDLDRRARRLKKGLGSVGLRFERGTQDDGGLWGEASPRPGLFIANSAPGVLNVFAGSPWPATAWREPLRDLPGTHVTPGPVKFSGIGPHRATFVPFGLLGIDDEDLRDDGDG